MSKIKYLDPSLVQDRKCTGATPMYGRNKDGYGVEIPSSHMLKVGNRWRRIYITQFSNAGSAWIILNKEKYYLENI